MTRNKIQLITICLVVAAILLTANISKVLAGECESAALRCLVTAALTGNPAVGGGVAAWCAVGYSWCKAFFK